VLAEVKVIAQRGGPNYLLVETRTVGGQRWGRIWNVSRREMGREVLVDAIVKFGYWEAYTGPQPTQSEMAGVSAIGGFDGRARY